MSAFEDTAAADDDEEETSLDVPEVFDRAASQALSPPESAQQGSRKQSEFGKFASAAPVRVEWDGPELELEEAKKVKSHFVKEHLNAGVIQAQWHGRRLTDIHGMRKAPEEMKQEYSTEVRAFALTVAHDAHVLLSQVLAMLSQAAEELNQAQAEFEYRKQLKREVQT